MEDCWEDIRIGTAVGVDSGDEGGWKVGKTELQLLLAGRRGNTISEKSTLVKRSALCRMLIASRVSSIGVAMSGPCRR